MNDKFEKLTDEDLEEISGGEANMNYWLLSKVRSIWADLFGDD